MTARFQDAALVASPSYPDAIAWSQENLIAVASGHIVTILNPAFPSGPRGLVTVPNNEPYLFGIVKREDLMTDALLPICMNRDRRPCARSLSWSPIGMAPNFGCLLAVCTAEGHVKIYRPPFCDFCAEWVEIMDITDMLYDYLSTINFGKPGSPDMNFSDDETSQLGSADERLNVFLKKHKRRKIDQANKINQFDGNAIGQLSCLGNLDCQDDRPMISSGTDEGEVFGVASNKLEKKSHHVIVSMSQVQEKAVNKTPRTRPTSLISVDNYVARDAVLSSLVVAWSPLLRLSSQVPSVTSRCQSNWFSLVAVGAKSGGVAIWKIYAPKCYHVEHSDVSTSVMLIGLLDAHTSWATALSWVVPCADSSNPQVLLVTGSFDGSVKIWMNYAEELQKSSEVNNSVFSLLKQVIDTNHVPVSALSPVVPVRLPQRMLLAIGKASGSLEVWICDLSTRKFKRSGSCNAHDQAVMGLAWNFDGSRLYSCGQDNFAHSWSIHESSFTKVPIASNTPGPRCSSDLPDAFLSCLGVAMSPGNLAIALVRSFNTDLLDQMYQARIQKAAVEFLWNGSQQCNLLKNSPGNDTESVSGRPEKELACWEANIIWSLKQLEDVNKPLVVWDITAALLTFKQSIPEYVEHTVIKWLSVTYLRSCADLSTNLVLAGVSKSLSKASSRQLHLLNVICRIVILSEMKADQVDTEVQDLRKQDDEDEELRQWLELLHKSESELRERLVGYCLSSSLEAPKASSCEWNHKGLAQMVQWVELATNHVDDQLKSLASKIKLPSKRSKHFEYAAEEKCCYCSSSVPFDSPDVAYCQRSEHKLERCAVSMQACPTTPSWYCKCCRRWTSNLPPGPLFAMPSRPSDFKSLSKSSKAPTLGSTPFCPFCGILLQRQQPDFLLSASPV